MKLDTKYLHPLKTNGLSESLYLTFRMDVM